MKPIQLFPIIILLTACSESPVSAKTGDAPVSTVSAATAPHGLDAKLIARGGEVYKANCAACHGANAEGAPNWSKKGPDGKFPATAARRQRSRLASPQERVGADHQGRHAQARRWHAGVERDADGQRYRGGTFLDSVALAGGRVQELGADRREGTPGIGAALTGWCKSPSMDFCTSRGKAQLLLAPGKSGD